MVLNAKPLGVIVRGATVLLDAGGREKIVLAARVRREHSRHEIAVPLDSGVRQRSRTAPSPGVLSPPPIPPVERSRVAVK